MKSLRTILFQTLFTGAFLFLTANTLICAEKSFGMFLPELLELEREKPGIIYEKHKTLIEEIISLPDDAFFEEGNSETGVLASRRFNDIRDCARLISDISSYLAFDMNRPGDALLLLRSVMAIFIIMAGEAAYKKPANSEEAIAAVPLLRYMISISIACIGMDTFARIISSVSENGWSPGKEYAGRLYGFFDRVEKGFPEMWPVMFREVECYRFIIERVRENREDESFILSGLSGGMSSVEKRLKEKIRTSADARLVFESYIDEALEAVRLLENHFKTLEGKSYSEVDGGMNRLGEMLDTEPKFKNILFQLIVPNFKRAHFHSAKCRACIRICRIILKAFCDMKDSETLYEAVRRTIKYNDSYFKDPFTGGEFLLLGNEKKFFLAGAGNIYSVPQKDLLSKLKKEGEKFLEQLAAVYESGNGFRKK